MPTSSSRAPERLFIVEMIGVDNTPNKPLQQQVIHPYSKISIFITLEVDANDGVNQPRGCGTWLRCAVKITF